MADSLNVQLKATYTPDAESNRVGVELIGLSDTIVQFTSDMAGDHIATGIQTIGIIEEALDLIDDVSTNAFIIIKNLDDSNFVEVGLTGSYAGRINGGELIAFRANGAIFLKADTANVQVQFWAFQA